MIIENGKLLSVNASDLDSRGVLHIPDSVREIETHVGCNIPELRRIIFPSGLKKIGSFSFCKNPNLTGVYILGDDTKIGIEVFGKCDKLTTAQIPRKWAYPSRDALYIGSKLRNIIRIDNDGRAHRHPVRIYNDTYYQMCGTRKIAGVEILYLKTMSLENDHLIGQPYIGLHVGQHTCVAPYEYVFGDMRKKQMMQKLERQMWLMNVDAAPNGYDVSQTLRNIAESTIKNLGTKIPARKKFNMHIRKLPEYIEQIQDFQSQFPRGHDTKELYGATFDEVQTILSDENLPRGTRGSCTRWLKKCPVMESEMAEIVKQGYQNPGAFPFGWINNIEPSMRGAVTQKLHDALRTATMQMYCPQREYEINEPAAAMDITQDLAFKIAQIIHKPVKISYMRSGAFAKAYKIEVHGAAPHVWKIYHSNPDRVFFHEWAHDTELQNSFLVSGRKYYGAIKYRKIATAGISMKRGEKYLLYPYTDAAPQAAPRDPHRTLKMYTLYDFEGTDNCHGNTLTDTGALRMNLPRWWCGRHMAKIINTVLYHAWSDLDYVCAHYTSNQIKQATDYIESQIDKTATDYIKICDKIEYLNQHARVR